MDRNSALEKLKRVVAAVDRGEAPYYTVLEIRLVQKLGWFCGPQRMF